VTKGLFCPKGKHKGENEKLKCCYFIQEFSVFLSFCLAALIVSIFLRSFKNFWHHGKHICSEGLFNNAYYRSYILAICFSFSDCFVKLIHICNRGCAIMTSGKRRVYYHAGREEVCLGLSFPLLAWVWYHNFMVASYRVS